MASWTSLRLGDQLAIRLGEQPRQPSSVASCNSIKGDCFHLVERDARRLIQADEVSDRCKCKGAKPRHERVTDVLAQESDSRSEQCI